MAEQLEVFLNSPTDEIYALGTSIYYDNMIIDSESIKLELTDSWLNEGDDLLFIQKNYPSDGRIYFSLSKKITFLSQGKEVSDFFLLT